MNYKTIFFLITLLLTSIISACSEQDKATLDVVKNNISEKISALVGKSEIAIQTYKNKIESTKEKLIQIKISRKIFSEKIEKRRQQLEQIRASNESGSNSISEKEKVLEAAISDMEKLSSQLSSTEQSLETTLNDMITSFDIIKLKIEVLEARKAMLIAAKSVDILPSIENPIVGIENEVNSAISELKKGVYRVEAELEVEDLLTNIQ